MKKLITLFLIFMSFSILAQNPQLLKDVVPGNNTGTIQNIVKTTNYTFFNENDGGAASDRSLYRTDGTPAGTIKLNLTYPGYVSTKADKLTAFGNKIVFAGDNKANYGEIWSSDGTQAGTVAIERFQPINNNVPVVEINSMGSYAYYSVIDKSPVDGLNHAYLRRTDGTVAGTSLVYDFSAFAGIPQVVFLTPMNGILYFIVYDAGGTGYDQLWRSDGTNAGTYLVYNFGAAQFVGSRLMIAGNNIYIMTGTPGVGNVLWKSDGTAAGTGPLKTIFSTMGGNYYPQNLAIGSNLVFSGKDGNGMELWVTDGTAAGTNMVADINPGAANSNPANFTFLNNNLYFSATSALSGNELWKSDGSVEGTVIVKDINPGVGNSNPSWFSISGNTILFNANNATTGGELWITDGTTANTVQATDMNPGAGSAFPNLLTPGNPVYFAANNGTSGFEVFKYDNTDGIAGLHKIYVNDNSNSGNIFTTAEGSNTNPGTRTAPVATISYAVTIAQPGDTIIVDAGSYTEQVNITKAITIRGAGMGVTIINSPAAPLSQLPNTVAVAIIQADANLGDVNIESLTIDGTNLNSNFYYSIFIQESGRVSNCEIRNVDNGFLFRDMSGTARTVVVNNNYIHQIKYIGGFFLGSGLQATATGNVIDFNGALYGMALLAGDRGDPYFVKSFTATNNSIINHNGFGILVNSTQPSIVRNNSITAIAGPSIEVVTTAAVDATCNWFGTADANVIIPRVKYYVGTANYSPWLSNGTDNDVAIGFQPLPNVCNGRQNKFYVNDAVQIGDVFTTAVGNDANSGIPSAPLLTIDAALTKASAGDTIYVDAGMYNLSSQLNINKSITIRGTNYLISPNAATDPLLSNGNRNAETIISNTPFNIGANNINIVGMTFDPQANFAIKQTDNTLDFDNVKIANNIFRITSDNRAIQIYGKFQMPLVTFDYFITDNRFIKEVSNFNTAIIVAGINNVQVLNNTFTVSTDIANRTQTAMSFGTGTNPTFRVDNLLVRNNTAYRQNFVLSGISSKIATIDFNKAIECIRFAITNNALQDPCEINITDNIITDSKTTGGPVISYVRNNGVDGSSPNIGRIERNTITINGTGMNFITQALIAPTIDNLTQNSQVIIRDNKLTYTGDFSSLSSPNATVGGIRFLNNSRQAVVERNEIEFNVTNYNPANKFGIYILHSGLQPGTNFDFLNNKISGFSNSVAFIGSTGFGELPAGVTANINNNSFTNDVLSINNGTQSQSVNASCNWYGSAAAQNFINKLSLSTVDIVPWLTNGTDNDAATGFQPVPNACDGYPTLITLNSSSNVTCNGAANGAINITTSYGKAPFTYTWSKDGNAGFVSHDEVPTNFGPGTYHLSLVDGNGSTLYVTDPEADGPGTIDVTITEPDILTASASGINVSCFNGANGTASVTASGGTLPYTYAWSNGATTSSISNLTAGTYNVIVTDAHGCTAQSGYEVTQPSLLIATATGTNVDCNGNSTGTATVSITGGTTAYSYLWSNGATSASISNLIAGNYSVTVTDANGCTAQSSYTVTEPAVLTATATGTSTSCANTATVVASGGTVPYSYAWSNGATTQFITSIPAGTYSVVVTDNKGCTATSSITVTANQAFNPSASVTNVSCFGTSTGSLMITNVNGVSPFQFSLDGVNFSSSSPLPFTFSGLAAGTYTITVKDFNGCTGFVSKTITEPPQLVVTLGSVQSTCSGQSTGSINVTTIGGSGSLSYSWTGPGGYANTQKNISGLATGNYTLIVTDANGCSKNLNVNVPVYAAINVSANITNVSCFGNANGSIDLTVTGGTGSGFTYLWNNGATTQDRINLAPGTNYKVTITDIGSGCQLQNITYAIGQPAALGLTPISNSDVNGCISMGVIEVAGAGGTAPYKYKLNYNGSYQSSGLFQGLPGTTTGIIDTVWVKDANGCTFFKSYTIKDDGKDGYENNNGKNSATVISVGLPVSAKAVNGDIDYFKLNGTNTWTGSYTLALSQSPSSVTYYLTQSNGAAIVQASDSSATYKHYNNLSGTYFVKVFSGTSYNCYQLTVSSGIITKAAGTSFQQEVTKAPVKDGLFDVKVLGNPSSSGFVMNIISSSDEKISMRIFDAQGRLIEERQGLLSMSTLRLGEHFINGIYIAEIRQGMKTKNVRLIKM